MEGINGFTFEMSFLEAIFVPLGVGVAWPLGVRGGCRECRVPMHYSRHISETVRLSTSTHEVSRD